MLSWVLRGYNNHGGINMGAEAHMGYLHLTEWGVTCTDNDRRLDRNHV